MAKIVSQKTGIKLKKTLIKKIKTTRQQSKLSRLQRQANLTDSFKIANNKIDNIDKKTFIIVYLI